MTEETEKKSEREIVIKVPEFPRTSKRFWTLATMVFLFTTVLLVVRPQITGGCVAVGGVSTSQAAGKAVKWIESYYVSNGVDADVTLLSSKVNENGLVEFEISVSTIDSQYTEKLYASLDGEVFLPNVIYTSGQSGQQQQPAADIPKSDKPVVELFVWGYCPYGVQAQGPLAEVASLLEGYADFRAVMYYDGHGAYETQQNKIQECIQIVAPEKYWEYAAGFVEDIYPKCSATRDVDCDKTEAVNLMDSLGIDSGEVLSCVDSQGAGLISEASSRASELSVTGSPTLVINGVKANTARTAEAFKTAICSAFNTVPEKCSQQLSGAASTASGSC